MVEQVSLLQVLQILAIIGGGIAIYVKMQTKLKELEIRMAQLEKSVEHNDKQDDLILQKLEDIKDQITELKVEMQNKQDK